MTLIANRPREKFGGPGAKVNVSKIYSKRYGDMPEEYEAWVIISEFLDVFWKLGLESEEDWLNR